MVYYNKNYVNVVCLKIFYCTELNPLVMWDGKTPMWQDKVSDRHRDVALGYC